MPDFQTHVNKSVPEARASIYPAGDQDISIKHKYLSINNKNILIYKRLYAIIRTAADEVNRAADGYASDTSGA